MITLQNRRIIDIRFNPTEWVRIKEGIINGSIVYSNPIETIHIKGAQYINYGDISRYYINIQNKDYRINEIECDVPDAITINEDGLVVFRQAGIFNLTLTFKTYKMQQQVVVQHLAFYLN